MKNQDFTILCTRTPKELHKTEFRHDHMLKPQRLCQQWKKLNWYLEICQSQTRINNNRMWHDMIRPSPHLLSDPIANDSCINPFQDGSLTSLTSLTSWPNGHQRKISENMSKHVLTRQLAPGGDQLREQQSRMKFTDFPGAFEFPHFQTIFKQIFTIDAVVEPRCSRYSLPVRRILRASSREMKLGTISNSNEYIPERGKKSTMKYDEEIWTWIYSIQFCGRTVLSISAFFVHSQLIDTICKRLRNGLAYRRTNKFVLSFRANSRIKRTCTQGTIPQIFQRDGCICNDKEFSVRILTTHCRPTLAKVRDRNHCAMQKGARRTYSTRMMQGMTFEDIPRKNIEKDQTTNIPKTSWENLLTPSLLTQPWEFSGIALTRSFSSFLFFIALSFQKKRCSNEAGMDFHLATHAHMYTNTFCINICSVALLSNHSLE